MKLRNYVRLWFLIILMLSYECITLNFFPNFSILKFLQINDIISKSLDLSPRPGRTISLWYGWLGMGTMLLTNLYIVRKRLNLLKKIGNLSAWLDFHIFCGLVGPTLILFHTNFKIRGLVAMSFWSMMISFGSGIVGRYFFMQLLSQKSDLERSLRKWDAKIKAFETAGKEDAIEKTRNIVREMAGGGTSSHASKANLSIFHSVLNSLVGDVRLKFGMRSVTGDLPPLLHEALVQYAVTERRIFYLEPFRRVMGYWHTFHTPFAIFMYIVAFIHIGTALLLRV